jgi:hypothetical protein
MTNRLPDISQRKAARIAGFGWLIIIIAGIFAEFVIRMQLIVPGDAATTANNIMDSEWLFRISIVSDLIMLAFDVVVALALYVVLKPVNRSLALLAAIFRLVMDAILGINLLNLIVALLLLRGADYLTVFETDQLHAQALLFLNAHSSGYDLALVFFGLSLLVLGYLVFKSGYIPRILGVLLIIASFGYLIDSFANVLLPQDEAIITMIASILIVLAIIAELSLSLWLIIKGGKIPETES